MDVAEMKLTYRGLHKEDERRLEEWVAKDPNHQTVDPSFFYVPRPGTAHFVVEENHQPIFYITIENVARIHIQFNPEGSRLKNAKTLVAGFPWLVDKLKKMGYHEIIFDSIYAPLIRFAKSVLGFTSASEDYKARI